jgi:hypothetical protein
MAGSAANARNAPRDAPRDVKREAREFINYQLLPLDKLMDCLASGCLPKYSGPLFTADHAPGQRPRSVHRTLAASSEPAFGHHELATEDPELFAAVEELRRTPWFRLRVWWATRRGGA